MIPHGFRPLLAVNHDKVSAQPNALYASEKIDGVRVMFFDGTAYSRTIKPLPNRKLQAFAREHKKQLEGCDGELVSGSLYAKDVLQKSVSTAMSTNTEEPFKIFLFDRFIPNARWYDRYNTLSLLDGIDFVSVLPHYRVGIELELAEFEQEVLARGGEGVMLRDAAGLYKFGRSGTRLPELQKVKRFKDIEAVVIGFAPLEHNANDAHTDELGYTKRSTSKDGKVAREMLGSLQVRLPNGKEFWVGSGFSEADRYELWAARDWSLGKQVTIKYFKESPDGIPLLPTFRTFRAGT